jgi:predicted  nucleic acid-binding Zn-ribbon protein
MTTELWTSLIGGVVLVLTALATYIKAHSDVKAIKDDREATKLARDREAQELRDSLMKALWEIDNLKRESNHKGTLLDDLQKQVNLLNQNLAVNNKTMENLVDAIRELKEKR